MLKNMVSVVSGVMLITEYMGDRATSWAVYQTVAGWASQPTAYRWCKRAESLGLIENVSVDSHYDWVLTEKGRGLYESYKSYPF